MQEVLPTKKALARAVADRFSVLAEARRALGRAVETRAEIVARLRELRSVYAELGEKTYLAMKPMIGAAGQETFDGEVYKVRIDGLHADITQARAELERILTPRTVGGDKKAEAMGVSGREEDEGEAEGGRAADKDADLEELF